MDHDFLRIATYFICVLTFVPVAAWLMAIVIMRSIFKDRKNVDGNSGGES